MDEGNFYQDEVSKIFRKSKDHLMEWLENSWIDKYYEKLFGEEKVFTTVEIRVVSIHWLRDKIPDFYRFMSD